MRVVLDTNVFVSMTLGGHVGKINDAWKADQFTLVVSDAILSEYLDVLSRPKLHLTSETVSVVIARVERKADFVTPTESIHAVEADPTDNKFLEAALRPVRGALSGSSDWTPTTGRVDTSEPAA